jgi:two-component system, cell cycle sensor histidine kinase and response regulator CckA
MLAAFSGGFSGTANDVAEADSKLNPRSDAVMNVITQFPAAYRYDRDLLFRAVFEEAAIGIAICQLDGRILEANAVLTTMLGYSQQELADIHGSELYPDLRPDPGCEMYSGALLPGERLLGELIRGERNSLESEKHYRRKDGSKLWGHLTVSLGRDERHQPAFLIATLADATERKRVEDHLREAEKMEVIGRLAGGIAHDFNNLLTGILLYCDLLSAGLESDSLQSGELERPRTPNGKAQPRELGQHVEEVRRAGEQGAAMTQQLLAIARKQAAEPRPVQLNEIVASTQNLLRRLIGEQIELVLDLDPGLDPVLDPAHDQTLDPGAGLVLADPAQLRQVLLNLVLNARDAMPRGGKITVSTRVAEFPRQVSVEVSSNGKPGGAHRAISLAVTDNGCGMDVETRARLFEPFFTTKKPGEGTGLGLATVQRIVSETGGTISVESAASQGTRIEVFLPAIEPSTKNAAPGKAEPESPPDFRLRERADGTGSGRDRTDPQTIFRRDPDRSCD